MRNGKGKRGFDGWIHRHAAKQQSARVVRRATRALLRVTPVADLDGAAYPVPYQDYWDDGGRALDARHFRVVANTRNEVELDRDLYYLDLDDQEYREDNRYGWSAERIKAVEVEDLWFDRECEERAERLADLDQWDQDNPRSWDRVIHDYYQIEAFLAGCNPVDPEIRDYDFDCLCLMNEQEGY
jgi:hypothetical protein